MNLYKIEDIKNTIICGDALETLKGLPEKRNKGKFIKGIHYCPKTEFKKGHHWRNPKPYWDKDWLYGQYIILGKSSTDIAIEFGCRDTNIQYFLKKFEIKRRNVSEARKLKYWGAVGKNNPMYGKYGQANPRWNGGHSPERQSKYARFVWKELAKSILKRDNYKCTNCNIVHAKNNKLIVHHKKAWSKYPELRFEPSNLITLCERCHKNVHKKN